MKAEQLGDGAEVGNLPRGGQGKTRIPPGPAKFELYAAQRGEVE